ncbi:MAG: selenite/tellurite reduction operon b-type cytochrome membrane protein ExtQ [Syntrophales bacterium]
MKDYIKSSPHFFRLIKLAAALFCGAVFVLAFFITAPLQAPADIRHVPNPVKSAWFLLWIQELVSYSSYLSYLVAAIGAFFLLIPWLPISSPATRARWFADGQLPVTLITVVTFTAILTLTIIAMFFRGENWSFIAPVW